MKKTLIYIISVIGLFSCDLDEVPVSEVSKEPVITHIIRLVSGRWSR